MLDLFHFLRPSLLFALPIIVLLWWLIRPKKKPAEALTREIAPHLIEALLIDADDQKRFFPIDTLAIAMVLLCLAAAGPTWSRAPNPLLAQTAPLAVALKVTPSMEQTDVQPSRLQRANFKIQDLMTLRAGAQTALFAYAGSAHRVAPLTQDPKIVSSYLQGLTAETMPKAGDRADVALMLAQAELERAETPGAILFVLDDFDPVNLAGFSENATDRAPVVFLVAGPASLDIPQLSSVPNASVVHMSVDDSDIRQIERKVRAAYRAALAEDDDQDWQDRGWLLAWPVAFLILLTFRRGWTMQWALVLLLTLPFPQTARADGAKDWFFTPDQQGWMAYQNKDFAEAATHFQDPEWSAYTLYLNGQYEEATTAFARLETAEGAFGAGMALLRNRKYRDGVRAIERALELDSSYQPAITNLPIAKAIVASVENTQEQSDSGEDRGIGADDTVFDNESGAGAETEVSRDAEEAASLTDEQWMRSVDTDVGAFLSTRFRLESAGETQ